MAVFDKNAIESFAEKIDDELVESTFSKLAYILENAVNDIRKRNPYINENYQIIPVNEFFNYGITAVSTIDVFLVISSSQLEFNTVKLINNRFSTFLKRLKYSWKNRKKNKKKDKYLKKNEPIVKEITIQNYSIPDFNIDLVNSIVNYITQMTMCITNRGLVSITGVDLPFKVRIFPVINKYGTYNYYLYNKNRFFNIDFKERFENTKKIYDEFGENFVSLIRIFNSLYYNLYTSSPNQILIESIIYNLPKETFQQESNYKIFLSAINFLTNNPVSELVSVVDGKTKLFKEKLACATIGEISQFFTSIKKYMK